MIKTKLIITICFLFCFGFTNLNAQSNNVSSGGEATGAGGNVSFTIGQIDYVTNTGGGTTSSQGVQQTYEFLTLGGNEIRDIILESVAYPNPTASTVNLKVENKDYENLYFSLFDQNGKLLINQRVTEEITTIHMESMAAASYLLKVIQDNKEIKSYKIIKN